LFNGGFTAGDTPNSKDKAESAFKGLENAAYAMKQIKQ
jgi:hypothetical protein